MIGHLTESAAARLWTYAAGLDRREFAICAGSVGLTMAQSFVRHGRAGDAASAVPGIVRTMEQALALAEACPWTLGAVGPRLTSCSWWLARSGCGLDAAAIEDPAR